MSGTTEDIRSLPMGGSHENGSWEENLIAMCCSFIQSKYPLYFDPCAYPTVLKDVVRPSITTVVSVVAGHAASLPARIHMTEVSRQGRSIRGGPSQTRSCWPKDRACGALAAQLLLASRRDGRERWPWERGVRIVSTPLRVHFSDVAIACRWIH